MGNRNLRKAAKAKNDEFYTLLEDIELELKHYDLSGKVVYCNCDDPHKSNFVKYFIDNFNELGIDRLYATHYTPDDGLLCKNDEKPNFMLEYDGSYKYSVLLGDGDFRSDECVDILKRCDVVVTNPPFSLFREFVDLIMSHKKDFLVISNQNAITYKEFFPLLKDGTIKLGANKGKSLYFGIPDEYKLKEGKRFIMENGLRHIEVPSISWFTTLHHDVPTKPLKLTKTYNEKDYQKYDNYNAINVDRVKDIPKDYFGYMGVPITYMNRHNSSMFSIEGLMNGAEKNEGIRYPNTKNGLPLVGGKSKYARIIIKRK